MGVLVHLHPRENDPVNHLKHSDAYFGSISTTAKFSVFGAIVVFAVVFVGLSYWHIRHRRKKGLEPLKYQRWLIPRGRKPMFGPQPPRPTYLESTTTPAAAGSGPEEYKLTDLRPPPPVYNADVPPAYQHDVGAPTATTETTSSPSNPSDATAPSHVYR